MTAWTRKSRTVVVAGVAAAVAVSGTGVALAATTAPSTAATHRTSAHARLLALQGRADRRFTAAEHRLSALRERVDHLKALAGDRSMLDAEMAALSGQLTTARRAVDTAPTLAQARKDLRGDRSLAAQGRVIVRQVRQLRQADAAAIAAAKTDTSMAALTTRVDALPAGSPARAALTDLQARIADATHQSALITAADRALSVSSPAAASKVLTANGTALTALRVDHQKAAADRRQIRSALRAHRRSGATTPAA